MFQVHCIKCRVGYESQEQDDYYCPSCYAAKMVIAEEVDRKVKARQAVEGISRKSPTIDELPKVPGTNYISARALGL